MDLKEAVGIVEKKIRKTQWRNLGRKLGFDDSELDYIEHDYRHHGLQEIIHHLLAQWSLKQGSNATVEILASALELSGLSTLATVIHPGGKHCRKNEDYCKMLEASLNNEESLALQDMTAMLRQRYFSTQLPHFAWEEDTPLPLEELYVELSLCKMENFDEEGTPIKLEELFRVNSMSSTTESIKKRYLIEGAPGYGKSTMLTKIGYDWATEKAYISNQFHVVIIVSLRELTGSFNDLLNTEISVEGHSNSTIGTLMQKLQSRILLLLDGYDELPPGNHDDLHKLLKGEKYPRMTIFLTSRLRYTDILRTLGSFWNQRIEIKGISEKQRKEFLRKYLKMSPEVVEEKMSLVFKKPIDGLFECPLFLILIATVTEQEMLDSITTKTQLYKTVFTFMVRRSLIREKLISETISFDLFYHLNEGTTAEKFLRIFWREKSYRYYHLLVLFGQFAVSMIKQSKLHFHKEEVLTICKKDTDIFRLGFLMSTVKSTSTRKRQPNYYEPVHKSFLEFLAALYLADLAKNNNRRVFTNEAQELLKSGLQPESTVFLFSFLGGLLGNKAHWLLEDVIYVSESMFSSTERQRIFQVISDMNASEELIKCVNRLLPNCINVDKYHMNKEVNASVQCGFIKTLEFNLNSVSSFSIPAVDVENLVLVNASHATIVPQWLNRTTCKRLICHLQDCMTSDSAFPSTVSQISTDAIVFYVSAVHNSKFLDMFNSDQFFEIGNKIHSITYMDASSKHLRHIIQFFRRYHNIRQLAIHFNTLSDISNELVILFFSAVLTNKRLRGCVISVPSGNNLLTWRQLFHSSVIKHKIYNSVNERDTSLKVTLGCNTLDVADCKSICKIEIIDGIYFLGKQVNLNRNQCQRLKEVICYNSSSLRFFPNVETVIITDVGLLRSIIELKCPVLRLVVVYNDYFNDIFAVSHKQIEPTEIVEGSYSKRGEFDNFHRSFMLTTTMNYIPSNMKSTEIPKSQDFTLKFFTNNLFIAYLKLNLDLVKKEMRNNHVTRCIVVSKHRHPHEGVWTISQFKSQLQQIFPPSLFSITEQINECLCMLETFPETITNEYEFYREYVITCNPKK